MTILEILEERRKVQKNGRQMTIAAFCRVIQVNPATYFRWLAKEGVPECSRVKTLKMLGMTIDGGHACLGDIRYVITNEKVKKAQEKQAPAPL
jgi:hypothetical protein